MAIDEAIGIDIRDLRARFRGALLREGEEGYDEARHAAVAHRVPRDGVTAAPDGDRQLAVPREAHRLDHVVWRPRSVR